MSWEDALTSYIEEHVLVSFGSLPGPQVSKDPSKYEDSHFKLKLF